MRKLLTTTLTAILVGALTSIAASQQNAPEWQLSQDHEGRVKLTYGWTDSEAIVVLRCEVDAALLSLVAEIEWDQPYPRSPQQPDNPGAYDVEAFPFIMRFVLGEGPAAHTVEVEGWPNDSTGRGLIVETEIPLASITFETLSGKPDDPLLAYTAAGRTERLPYQPQEINLLEAFFARCNGR